MPAEGYRERLGTCEDPSLGGRYCCASGQVFSSELVFPHDGLMVVTCPRRRIFIGSSRIIFRLGSLWRSVSPKISLLGGGEKLAGVAARCMSTAASLLATEG